MAAGPHKAIFYAATELRRCRHAFDGLKTGAPEGIVSGVFVLQEEMISPLLLPPRPGYGPTFAAGRKKGKKR